MRGGGSQAFEHLGAKSILSNLGQHSATQQQRPNNRSAMTLHWVLLWLTELSLLSEESINNGMQEIQNIQYDNKKRN